MKKLFYIFLAACFLVGCKGETVDVASLVAERDSLKEENSKTREELNLLNGFVSEISSGLDSIAMQEQLLRDNGREGHGMSRAEMKQSIKELGEMLARQRERLAAYENSSNVAKIEGLQSIIAHLNSQLEEKQKLITNLYAEINSNKASIATLKSHISSLNENGSSSI